MAVKSIHFYHLLLVITASLLLEVGVASPVGAWAIGQEVSTTSGKVQGHASKWQPEVSEYLGIPYAEPPVDSLRFAPPKTLRRNQSLEAKDYSPDCMQTQGFDLKIPTLTPELKTFEEGLGVQSPRRQSEDCLTLNIWTKPQVGEKSKAVMFWIYGGAYTIGTSNAPYYNGAKLADQEDVIVVSINYRVNIFGFPRGPGLENVGLLDQRLAIEWVRDNIAGFDGDPKRITIFGESAGAFSADTYSYTWVQDPIVNGFILQSGTSLTAMNLAHKPDVAQKSWFNVTQRVDCGGIEAGAKTIECMRKVPAQKITDAVRAFTGRVMMGPFQPVINDKTLFSDTRARADAGKFIKRPVLLGSNDHEFGIEVAMPGVFGPIVSALLSGGGDVEEVHNVSSEFAFNCPAAYTAAARRTAGVPAWRYRYMPKWENLQLVPKIGAYHTAEIPMVFSSNTQLQSMKPNTPEEDKISSTMRHAWAAFAKDPENGLTKLGWPLYDPKGPTVIRIGHQNKGEVDFVSGKEFDVQCPAIDGMDGTMGLIGS